MITLKLFALIALSYTAVAFKNNGSTSSNLVWDFVSKIAAPSQNCLQCICEIESGTPGKPGCGTIKGDAKCGEGCVWDVGSCSCGPYQIKQAYFTDCSEHTSLPIKDWRNCTTDVACATACVVSYLDRYGRYCTGTTSITCEQYGGIHNGGPKGCNAPQTAAYREKVRACCAGGYC